MNPRFPIYIPSKGRWKSRHTMRAFDRMGVDYRVIVEAAEAEAYASVIDPARILVLPQRYLDDYDTVDGAVERKGSGPARNFAWDQAIASGASHHWIVDDNIYRFMRGTDNLKIQVSDGTILRCMEDFALRYRNVALSGPNYETFFHRKDAYPPFVLNSKVYSCILIRNDLSLRWRGRFNEDVDLCLRALKAGWCTIAYNAFLQKKIITQAVKGGNTTAYRAEGTRVKSQMLVDMHPDCARVIWRFKRWHHYVDWGRFIHPLVRDPAVPVRRGVNDYGMKLVKKKGAIRAPEVVIARRASQ